MIIINTYIMSYQTTDLYNEDEYFIKFKNIHPILYYSNKIYDIKKKEFQIQLLQQLTNDQITNDELNEKYNNFISLELKYKIIIDTIEYDHTQILNNMKKKYEDILINYLDSINN